MQNQSSRREREICENQFAAELALQAFEIYISRGMWQAATKSFNDAPPHIQKLMKPSIQNMIIKQFPQIVQKTEDPNVIDSPGWRWGKR